MANTRTPNALLGKPATADRNWDVTLNANVDFLDGVASIGRLLVTPAEMPSASLKVRVTAGKFLGSDGQVKSFSGVDFYTVPASASLCLWLTDLATLASADTFPVTPHVRLAKVITGATSIVSVRDERVTLKTCAAGSVASVAPAKSVLDLSSGVSSPALTIDPAGPAVGFFGNAPATQAPAVSSLKDTTMGAVSDTIVDVGPTYSQFLIDDNFAALAAKVNALTAALKRHGLMAN